MRHWSLYPLSFLHPAGLGWSARDIILRSMRANSALSSASSSFWADALMSRENLATRTSTLHAIRPVLLVRNAFLLAARFGDEAIPEILPNGAVFLQVDEHSGLAALGVGYELD